MACGGWGRSSTSTTTPGPRSTPWRATAWPSGARTRWPWAASTRSSATTGSPTSSSASGSARPGSGRWWWRGCRCASTSTGSGRRRPRSSGRSSPARTSTASSTAGGSGPTCWSSTEFRPALFLLRLAVADHVDPGQAGVEADQVPGRVGEVERLVGVLVEVLARLAHVPGRLHRPPVRIDLGRAAAVHLVADRLGATVDVLDPAGVAEGHVHDHDVLDRDLGAAGGVVGARGAVVEGPVAEAACVVAVGDALERDRGRAAGAGAGQVLVGVLGIDNIVAAAV